MKKTYVDELYNYINCLEEEMYYGIESLKYQSEPWWIELIFSQMIFNIVEQYFIVKKYEKFPLK